MSTWNSRRERRAPCAASAPPLDSPVVSVRAVPRPGHPSSRRTLLESDARPLDCVVVLLITARPLRVAVAVVLAVALALAVAFAGGIEVVTPPPLPHRSVVRWLLVLVLFLLRLLLVAPRLRRGVAVVV